MRVRYNTRTRTPNGCTKKNGDDLHGHQMAAPKKMVMAKLQITVK